MKVLLHHRHYGIHDLRKEAHVPGVFSDYARPDKAEDWAVDEAKLIEALPDGFLPTDPKRILLAVDAETGGTGLRGLSRFRNWGKYFDAYVLHIQQRGYAIWNSDTGTYEAEGDPCSTFEAPPGGGYHCYRCGHESRKHSREAKERKT